MQIERGGGCLQVRLHGFALLLMKWLSLQLTMGSTRRSRFSWIPSSCKHVKSSLRPQSPDKSSLMCSVGNSCQLIFPTCATTLPSQKNRFLRAAFALNSLLKSAVRYSMPSMCLRCRNTGKSQTRFKALSLKSSSAASSRHLPKGHPRPT